jgi:metal-dependent hydrolase (beta-lactamase superfamily II)
MTVITDGIAFLIDDKVLFDRGEKGQWLINNMKNLNFDIDRLKAVVIFHDHWGHKGGLWAILKKNSKVKIYACPNFSKRFKNRVKSFGKPLIEVDRFTQIAKNIYTTIGEKSIIKNLAGQKRCG